MKKWLQYKAIRIAWIIVAFFLWIFVASTITRGKEDEITIQSWESAVIILLWLHFVAASIVSRLYWWNETGREKSKKEWEFVFRIWRRIFGS